MAQYGSDAIVGVINILLREDTALHGSASAGTTYDGGGDTYEVSLGGGIKLGDDGFINATGTYRDHKTANRALPATRQYYFGISPTGTPQPLSARYGAGLGLNPPGGVAGNDGFDIAVAAFGGPRFCAPVIEQPGRVLKRVKHNARKASDGEQIRKNGGSA